MQRDSRGAGGDARDRPPRDDTGPTWASRRRQAVVALQRHCDQPDAANPQTIPLQPSSPTNLIGHVVVCPPSIGEVRLAHAVILARPGPAADRPRLARVTGSEADAPPMALAPGSRPESHLRTDDGFSDEARRRLIARYSNNRCGHILDMGRACGVVPPSPRLAPTSSYHPRRGA